VLFYECRLDYDVAELTWENGQISMHGLGLPKVPVKPPSTTAATNPSKETWEKPARTSGTLESIVNQATSFPHRGKSPFLVGGGVYGNMLVPWLDPHRAAAIAAATNGLTVDALVPCSNTTKEQRSQTMDPIPRGGVGSCMVGGPTPVGSCSAVVAATHEEGGLLTAAKRVRVAHVAGSGRDQSMSNSATLGRQSQKVTLDTYDMEFGKTGFTSTSIASMDNTSSEKQCTRTNTVDDHDSVCHSRPSVRFSQSKIDIKSSLCWLVFLVYIILFCFYNIATQKKKSQS
jgi:hypothetical protein